MGVVNTTYTFTGTDTITSSKLNNIIDDTTFTSDAISGSSLQVVSPGKLAVAAGGITSNELANNSVTSAKIVDGTIVNADINASAAIAGTKIVSQFGTQGITATGNLGLYGSSSNYTAAALINTSGVETQLIANGNSNGGLATITNHPLTFITNNSQKMVITASGNVGVGTSNPTAPLHVQGQSVINYDAELTITGSSGYINFHNSLTGGSYNGIVSNGDKSIIFSDGSSDTGALVIAPWATNASGIRINSSGNVGICKSSPSTALDVNGTVTATAFSGPLTGNVTGSASTVSNSAITAAKLDGNQSGNAPIFGVRAWANINGTVGSVSVRQGGNVSGVVRNQLGRYTITFSTPMQDTNYAIIAWARDANATDNNYFVSAASNATKTTEFFQIEVNSPGGTVDSPEIGIMVIR